MAYYILASVNKLVLLKSQCTEIENIQEVVRRCNSVSVTATFFSETGQAPRALMMN